MGFAPANGLNALLSTTFDAQSILSASDQRLAPASGPTLASPAAERAGLEADRIQNEGWWRDTMERAGSNFGPALQQLIPGLSEQPGLAKAAELTPEESLDAATKRFEDSTADLNTMMREAAASLGPQAVFTMLEQAGVSLDSGISETFDELLTAPPSRAGEVEALRAELEQLTTNPPADMDRAAHAARVEELKTQIGAAERTAGTTGDIGSAFGSPADTRLADALEAYKRDRDMVEGLKPRPKYDWLSSAVFDAQRGMLDVAAALPKQAIHATNLVMELHAAKMDILTGRDASIDITRSHMPGVEALITSIDASLDAMTPKDDARAEDFVTTLAHGSGSMLGFLAVRAAGIPVAVAGSAVQGVAGYEDARARDAMAGQILTSWLLNSALGTTEAIPIDRFFRAAADDFGEDWLIQKILDSSASGLEEFVQETFQSLGQDAIAKYGLGGAMGEWSDGYDPERDISLHDALKNGWVGFLTGAGASAAVGALGQTTPPGPIGRPGLMDMTPEEQSAAVADLWRGGLQRLDELTVPEGETPPDPAVPQSDEEAGSPGGISAQVASLIADDVASYTQAETDFDPLVVPEEKAQKNLRAQVASDEVRRGERTAGNRWTPQERVVLTAPGTNLPPVAVGDITFEDWVTKVDGLATDEEIQRWGNWYAETTDTVAQRLDVDQDMAGRIVAAFLVANQQNSPSGSFLEAIVQAEEIGKGASDEDIRSAGLKKVALAVRKILRGEAIDEQFSIKIADFYDSAMGADTRRWMGNDPAGGAPFVIDRHSARDLGATSDAYLKMLAARGYEIPEGLRIDIKQQKAKNGRAVEGSISDGIYHNRASFGRDLTAHLNETGWHGRSDWTPAQVQAVGWMATLRLTGQKAEDMGASIDRNEAELAYEVVPTTSTGWGKEWGERLQALPDTTKRQITARIAGKARKIAFQKSRALSSSPVYVGSGGWENTVNPSAVTRVVASKESMEETALMLGLLLDQDAVFGSRVTPFTDSAKTVAIDLIFQAGMSRDATLDAFDAMQASGITNKAGESVFPGFMPIIYPDGREGIRLVAGETKTHVKNIQKWLHEGGFAAELGEELANGLDIFITQADVIYVENDWTKGSQGYADKLSEISGRDTVADLLRARETLHAELEEEIRQAEQRFADDGLSAARARVVPGENDQGQLALNFIGDPTTDRFGAWFGSSQVVDENGDPLVVYHGTGRAGFSVFERAENDYGDPGFWFSNSSEVSRTYGRSDRVIRDPEARRALDLSLPFPSPNRHNAPPGTSPDVRVIPLSKLPPEDWVSAVKADMRKFGFETDAEITGEIERIGADKVFVYQTRPGAGKEWVKLPFPGGNQFRMEEQALTFIEDSLATNRNPRHKPNPYSESGIMPAYLSLQNPLVVDYEGRWWDDGVPPDAETPKWVVRHPAVYLKGLGDRHPGLLEFLQMSEEGATPEKLSKLSENTYDLVTFPDQSTAEAYHTIVGSVLAQEMEAAKVRILLRVNGLQEYTAQRARRGAREIAEVIRQNAIAEGNPVVEDFDERIATLEDKAERENRELYGMLRTEDLIPFALNGPAFLPQVRANAVNALIDSWAEALYKDAKFVSGGETMTVEEAMDQIGRRHKISLVSEALRFADWTPAGKTYNVVKREDLGPELGDLPGYIRLDKSEDQPPVRPPATTDDMSNSYVGEVQPGKSKWRTRDFVRHAEEQGYDGVIFKNIVDTADGSEKVGDVYVALYPEQVKSATMNSGAYDPDNPDIYAMAGRPLGTSTTREPYVGETTRPSEGVSQQEAAAAGSTEAIALSDIGTRFVKLMNLAPGQGRFTLRGKEIMGQYNRNTGSIRLRSKDDVSTLFHEAGHDLHARQTGVLNPIISANEAEILKAATGKDRLYADDLSDATKAEQIREGFAELFRLFVDNRERARNYAPGFTRAMEQFLQQDAPQLYEGLNVIGAMMRAWANQSSADAFKAQIVSGKPDPWTAATIKEFADKGFPATVHRYLRDVTKGVVDRALPLRELEARLMRRAAQQGQLPDLKVADDPAKRFDLLHNSGAAAMMNFYHGVEGYRSNERISRGLQDALFLSQGVPATDKRIRKLDETRQRDFAAYLVARRSLAEIALGKLDRLPTREGEGGARKTIAEMEAKYGDDFTAAAEIVNEYGRALWKKRFDAGLLTREIYEEGMKREFYAPLQRDMSDRTGKVGEAFNRAAGATGMPLLHAIKGSDRDIIDPMVALMAQTFATEAAVAHNEVKVTLARLTDKAGMAADIVERVPAHRGVATAISLKDVVKQISGLEAVDEVEAAELANLMQPYMEQDAFIQQFSMQAANTMGEPMTFFWEEGKLQAMIIRDSELADDVIKLLDIVGVEQMNDTFFSTLAAGQVLVRQAITRWPDFIIRNFIRDQLQAWISTDVGYVPFVSGLKGAYDEIMGKEASKLYNAKGGLFGGVGVAQIDGARYNRDVAALKGKGYTAKMFARGKLAGLLHATEISETSTRIGIMEGAYQRAIRDGLSEYEAAMEATYIATDYMNYGLHGAKTNVIRKIVPFINAQVVGLHKMNRVLFASETARRVGRANALKMVVASYVKSVNGMPLTRAEQRDIEIGRKAWTKMSILATLTGVLTSLLWDDEDWQNRGEYIAETYWYIPTGNGQAITIPKPFEWALLSNAVERSIEALNGDKRAMDRFKRGAIRQTMPMVDNPVVTAIAEHRANHSFFYDRDLIPFWIQAEANYDPQAAVTPYTSQLAKDIGAAFGWKPILVDHYKDAMLATAGRDISTMYEQLRNPNAAGMTAYDAPVLRGSVRSTSRGTVVAQDFWDLMGQTEGRYTGAAGAYDSWLSSGDPMKVERNVAAMPEEERIFAFLNEHYEAKHKRLHPLRRAQDVSRVASALRKEMISPLGVADTSGYSGLSSIPLSPKQKALLAAELTTLSMREQRNAMITIGEPGWENKNLSPTEDTLAVIAAVSPALAEELERRLEKAKVYTYDAVMELWPEARRRLAENGPEAYLDDLVSEAEWW